jgi:hypothetical protein
MIAGQCECGLIQFEISGEVEDFSHCHCSQCRRMHGAAYASFAGVSKESFILQSGASDLASYRSSNNGERTFCPRCGSNIFVALDDEPDTLYVAMGVIDGHPPLPPGYHIYVGSKAPWHDIDDDLRQYDKAPADEETDTHQDS